MRFDKKINEILERLKDGEDCFAELYNLTYKHLAVVARMYLKDKSLFSDVLSEAYFSVCKNILSFDKNKNGYNWLCKIVQNKAFDMNISAKQTEQLSENISEYMLFDDEVTTNSDLNKALSELSVEESRMVYLKFFENKTYAEIGKIRGVSAPMIHKSIKKILKKIEKYLKNMENS